MPKAVTNHSLEVVGVVSEDGDIGTICRGCGQGFTVGYFGQLFGEVVKVWERETCTWTIQLETGDAE